MKLANSKISEYFASIVAFISIVWYRVATAIKALRVLYNLPDETIESFMNSYQIFDKEIIAGEEDAQNIVNYYQVLNELCAIGEVEKMYIPPLIDTNTGVFGNQLLFEQKMIRDLSIGPNSKVLDVGCGRGRIAAHVASTGAYVEGINIDNTQLEHAREYALSEGLTRQLNFKQGNFNDPLDFPDESFDALYQVQVLTYAKDKEALFREMYRVLKPGGKLSFLDWVKLDKYDPTSPKHIELINRVKPLIGAVDTPSPQELSSTLEKVGFEVTFSADASIGGHQADLIQKADTFYKTLTFIVHSLVRIRVFPPHFRILFDRLTLDGEAFIEADRMGLFTTSFQTIARKPLRK